MSTSLNFSALGSLRNRSCAIAVNSQSVSAPQLCHSGGIDADGEWRPSSCACPCPTDHCPKDTNTRTATVNARISHHQSKILSEILPDGNLCASTNSLPSSPHHPFSQRYNLSWTWQIGVVEFLGRRGSSDGEICPVGNGFV